MIEGIFLISMNQWISPIACLNSSNCARKIACTTDFGQPPTFQTLQVSKPKIYPLTQYLLQPQNCLLHHKIIDSIPILLENKTDWVPIITPKNDPATISHIKLVLYTKSKKNQYFINFLEPSLSQFQNSSLYSMHYLEKIPETFAFQKALMHAPKQSKDFNFLKRFYTCFNTAALVSAIFNPKSPF